MATGELTRMKIVAYENPDFSRQIGQYDVLVNPENYNQKLEQQYTSNSTTNGSSAPNIKFKGSSAQIFDLLLFFDGTGIISNKRVDDQIKEVKELTYRFNGNIHEPNYIRIYWGTQSLFQGRLKSWKTNYTMLDMDGTPLRAEVTAVFVSSVSVKKKTLEEQRNSSDLTHIRIVKSGDNLPLMCYRIYGDSSYYLKVARHNKLQNFRKIEPGDEIIFPPVI